jgi:hypothetical protein
LTGSLSGDASISGGLLHLDGDGDYVQLNGYAIPSDGRDYSILVSAQQMSRTPGAYMELISQGFSGTTGIYIGHDPSGVVRVGDALLGDPGLAGVLYPTDGLFHEFLLTSSMILGTSFYIDDVLVFSSSDYADVAGTGNVTRFGRQFDPYDEFFSGKIDYVGIYDGLLDPNSDGPVGVVPLPASALLLLSSALGLALLRRRR